MSAALLLLDEHGPAKRLQWEVSINVCMCMCKRALDHQANHRPHRKGEIGRQAKDLGHIVSLSMHLEARDAEGVRG